MPHFFILLIQIVYLLMNRHYKCVFLYKKYLGCFTLLRNIISHIVPRKFVRIFLSYISKKQISCLSRIKISKHLHYFSTSISIGNIHFFSQSMTYVLHCCLDTNNCLHRYSGRSNFEFCLIHIYHGLRNTTNSTVVPAFILLKNVECLAFSSHLK